MALYAYAVVEDGRTSPDDAALVAADGLAAVVREVDVAEFEGEELERNLADPAWLERALRDHERVVEGLLGDAPVVPMRFGSIFSTEEALRSMLSSRASDLRALLDRVRDRDEWGVKVHADAPALTRSLVPEQVRAGGRAYLERRQAELHAGQRVRDAIAAVADEIHRALAGAADAAALLPARGQALNAAYLVHGSDRDAFLTRVDDVERAHGPAYVIEVSGPWPPYSFTTDDVTGARS